MKKLIVLLTLVPLILGGWIVTDRVTFNRDAWIADYQQLRAATEHSYANLKWSRSSKRVDLVALNEQAMRDLQAATSNSAARQALGTFITGFQDGHFRIENGPPRAVAALMNLFERESQLQIDFTMTGAQACSALGFRNTSHSLQIEGSNIEPDPARMFAAGIITTPKGRKYGVIRIPLFQQREYASACESAWDVFRSATGGACDDECQERFGVIAKRAVAQALADDARALARRAPDGIVIDLIGNGGGTEWAEFAAAALTRKSLQPAAVAFVLGARGTCDLSAIWTDRIAQPSCWNITPPTYPNTAMQQVERPYDGPLYIMTDANTASASEQFAAVLVDNGVAKTIGVKTMGVGCGYTNGGNPVKLKNSGLVIWMPDCVRLRADGSNEFEGIKPDYSVTWGDDAKSRAHALTAALDQFQ